MRTKNQNDRFKRYKYFSEDYRVNTLDVTVEDYPEYTITGSGGGCFPAGTLVRTAHGYKPIETCQSGDMIITYDRFGELEHGYVIELKTHEYSEYQDDLYFIYSGEISLFPKGITGNHAVFDYITKEHKEIKDFSIGDNLVSLEGNLIEITDIVITVHEDIPEESSVYNLIVEPQHTYLVGDGHSFIRVHNGGGGKSPSAHVAVEDVNTLQSTTYARSLEVVSHGEIEEIVGGPRGFYLNGTVLQNSDLSWNFQGVSFDYRAGTISQTVIPGFEVTEIEDTVLAAAPIDITDLTFATRDLPTANVDSARITLRFPQGLSIYYKDRGDLKGHFARILIYTKATALSGWNLVLTTQPEGKTTSPWEIDFRITAPAGQKIYAIRVDRDQSDDNAYGDPNVIVHSMFQLARITQILHSSISYDRIALAACKIDAKAVGYQIPTRSYMVKGIKCKVPVGYTPTTRVYTGGYWDGVSFNTWWTDNPAWILYDIITNVEYGLADYLGQSIVVDELAFFEAAMYNDCVTWNGSTYVTNLIPNGQGGFEIRYKMNVVIAVQQDAWQLLQAIASCMRALVVIKGNQISLIQDRPKTSTRLFTTSNVLNGLFTYSTSEASTTATAINCTFSDEADRFLPRVITEPSQATKNQGWYNDADLKFGYNVKDIIAYGCTTESQARRMAKWALYTELEQGKTISFGLALNVVDLSPGDIVSIIDDKYISQENKFLSGRVISISGTTVNLGNSVTLIGGHTYTFSIMALDYSSMLERTITTGAGTWDILTLNSALQAGDYTNRDFFCYSTGYIDPQQYRISKIVEVEKGKFTIIGSLYDEQKYAAIENGLSIIPKSYTPPVPLYLPPVSNIQFFERYSNDGINSNNFIEVRWQWNENHAIKGQVLYRIRWKRDKGEYHTASNVITKDFHIPGTIPGIYNIIIEVESVQGKRSQPAYGTYNYRTASAPSTLEPPLEFYVAGITGTNFTGTHIPLTWKYNTANDDKTDTLLDYILEVWNTSGATKLNTFRIRADVAKFLADGVTPNPFYRGGKFNYTYEQNRNDYTTPSRSVQFRLYSRDMVGDKSIASTKTFTNGVPALTTWTVNPAFDSVYINITPSTEVDIAEYIIYRGTSAGFVKDINSIIYAGKDTYINYFASAGTPYWYAMSVVDTFGRSGALISTEINVSAVGADPDTYTYDGLDFKPNDPLSNRVSWTAFVVTRTTTSGVQTSWNVTAGNTAYTTGVLYLYYVPGLTTLSSNTSLLAAITAGGRVLATYQGGTVLYTENGRAFTSGDMILAGTVGANALITNTAVITNAAQIGNVIESSNYNWNPITPAYSGWRLDKNGWLQVTGIIVRNAAGQLLLSSGVDEHPSTGGTNTTTNNLTILEASYLTMLTTASSNATAAKAATDDIANDSRFTPTEKKEKRVEWEGIAKERPVLEDQANKYGSSVINTALSTYQTKFNALAVYLNANVAWTPTGTGANLYLSPIPSRINDTNISTTDGITKPTFILKYREFYDAKSLLLKTISDVSDDNRLAAKAIADAAKLDIDKMADDGKFSPVEKVRKRAEWDAIISEKAFLEAQATSYGITTEKTTYTNAAIALRIYLNGGTGTGWTTSIPLWLSTSLTDGLTVFTTIVANDFRTNWKNYYDAKLALQNKFPDTAIITANAAITATNEMASDAAFTPVEKKAKRVEWISIAEARPLLESQAALYSITTQLTMYQSKFDALATYLNENISWSPTDTIPPIDYTLPTPTRIDDTGILTTTVIGPNTFRLRYNEYYKAVVDLQKAITDKASANITLAATTANWDSVTGIPYATVYNNDDSAALGFNPTFAEWTGTSGTTWPTGWASYNGSAAPIRETSIVRVGRYAVRYNNVTGVNGGTTASVDVELPIGTFIGGSVDIYLPTRTSGLPGLLIRLYTNSAKTTWVDTMVQPTFLVSSVGVWIRTPFTARAPGSYIYGIRIYLMASYGTFPSGAFTGSVIFSNLRFALFDNSTDNSTISISSNGQLNGAGGGSVTVTGLGFTESPVTISNAVVNYNTSNDNLASAISAPTIDSTGLAIDHTTTTDSSASISFEWVWSGTEANIDGFQIFVRRNIKLSTIVDGVIDVNPTNDTINYPTAHNFITGCSIIYTSNGGGTSIGGLTVGTRYFCIKVDSLSFKLATSLANSAAGTFIQLTAGTGASHTFTGWRSFAITGTSNEEVVFVAPAAKRAFILYGCPADSGYCFGVRAYRKVNKNIDASGVIYSAIVSPINTGTIAESPYVPGISIAFSGDVTGTIDGDAANTVVKPANPISPSNASTYILNASIQTAHIANLAVTNALIENLAVGSGKIAALAVTSGKIADLAVSTLKIAGNAVTVPSLVTASFVVAGNAGYQSVLNLTINNTATVAMTGFLFFSCRQGYSAGVKTSGFRIYAGATIILDYGTTTAYNDYPNLSCQYTIPASTSVTFAAQFFGQDGTVTIGQRNLMFLGVKR